MARRCATTPSPAKEQEVPMHGDSTKPCSKCGLYKSLEQFPIHRSSKDNRKNTCKDCDNKRRNQRYWDNRETELADRKQYYIDNKERIDAKHREWASKNIQRRAELDRKWRLANPDKRRASSEQRRAQKNGSRGQVSAALIYQMAEDQQWLCAYCDTPLFGSFHVDHMIPLCKGGSHNWTNIAITCATCNLRKRTKTVEEFLLWKASL